MSMSEQQLIALANRINRLGTGVDLRDFMGALGLVLFGCFNQVPPDERLQNLTAWLSALFRQIAAAEHQRRAN